MNIYLNRYNFEYDYVQFVNTYNNEGMSDEDLLDNLQSLYLFTQNIQDEQQFILDFRQLTGLNPGLDRFIRVHPMANIRSEDILELDVNFVQNFSRGPHG